MTLKDILLQELETADDELITATIDWVRSRKGNPTTHDRAPDHPLRQIPIVIPADFDDPMTR